MGLTLESCASRVKPNEGPTWPCLGSRKGQTPQTGRKKDMNPLTVLKGYQELVDEQLVEKRRGLGMFVNIGARKALLKDERQRFLEDEWPKVLASIHRLGLSARSEE